MAERILGIGGALHSTPTPMLPKYTYKCTLME